VLTLGFLRDLLLLGKHDGVRRAAATRAANGLAARANLLAHARRYPCINSSPAEHRLVDCPGQRGLVNGRSYVYRFTVTYRRWLCAVPGRGRDLWWESQLFRIKCSTAGLGLVDCVLECGSEPPMHIYTREDEFIWVLDGQVTVWIGEKIVTASMGGFVFMPRTCPIPSGWTGMAWRVRCSCTPRAALNASFGTTAPPTTCPAAPVPRSLVTIWPCSVMPSSRPA